MSEQKVPTKEEILAMMAEQIEIKKSQVELQELNTKLATYRADEIKALAFIAQMTNPQAQPPTQPHTVTQEDLDANPELVDAGVQVGDEVLIPAQPTEAEEGVDEPKRKLKKQQA
jgi:hypothetical protein